ncbi:MAG: phage tail protein [Janthinobacterium lividum]
MNQLATHSNGIPTIPQVSATAERRNWLKRLGTVLGLGLLAGKAGAAPREVRQVTGAEDYLGEIMLFAGGFVPRGYLPCDGSLLQISQYPALFSLLGTGYGGNGSTTFGLPDLRNRVPRGTSTNNNYIDSSIATGGQATVTLTSNQLPAHAHALNVSSGVATSSDPTGNFPAAATGTLPSSDEPVTVRAYSATTTGTASTSAISSVGNSQPVPVLDPYTLLNYVICVAGIFPVRP